MADHAALIAAWRRTRSAYHAWMESKNQLTVCARGHQGSTIELIDGGYRWKLSVGTGPYPIVTSSIVERTDLLPGDQQIESAA